MSWVVELPVAAAVVLGGGLLARSWIGRLGGASFSSSGVWWSLCDGVAGRPRAAALVPVRSAPGRRDPRRAEEVWRS